jgi:hypothetical protein
VILLLIALILFATPAAAIDPERREAIVISGRLWDGFRHVEMFLPSDTPLLTVMAGRDSAISFVRTQEYYWPLSRQVHVDFERQRDRVAGLLRIEKDGAMIAEIAEQPFAILYPDGAVNGNATLLWGADAEAGFAAYLQTERDFNRRFVEAQRAQTAHEQALLDAARNGSRAAILPPPPVPVPNLRLVTRPQPAMRVDLAPGDYRISLVADGAVVPGTLRQLRVIPAEDRPSIVADILPEERWTRPLASNSEDARLYARAGARLYLTLFEASEFAERDYLSVVSPQSPASADRRIWVRRKPAEAATLDLRQGDAPTSLALSQFKVEQTSSSGFGYVVRPVRGGEAPDIEAFRIDVPTHGVRRLALDHEALNFRREVIVVDGRNGTLALIFACLPMALFAAARIARRRRNDHSDRP